MEDNVSVDGLTITAEEDLGDLIVIKGSDVTVSNMAITYETDSAGCAIHVGSDEDTVESVVIENNTIAFETHVQDSSEPADAINVENAAEVSVSGNTITASFPALDINYNTGYIYGFICSVLFHDVSGSSFTGNTLTATVSGASGFYPTADNMIFADCEDILIRGNTVSSTAAVSAEAIYNYGVYCDSSTDLEFDANSFDISDTVENADYGGVWGVYLESCTAEMTENTIRCDANGPVNGVSLSNWIDENQARLENNTITVSGYTTSDSSYRSVSGIQNEGGGDAVVTGNTIRAENKYETYNDDFFVTGIGVANTYGSTALDAQNNDIFTNGHYAVNVTAAVSAVTVTGNRLGAAALGGDAAVFVHEGTGTVTVENNTSAVAPPAFSPAGGWYAEVQDVALSCLTQGAVIHYTLNGDEPTAESAVYAEPIPVSETTVIRAVAVMEGFGSSPSAIAVYAIGSEASVFEDADFVLPAGLTEAEEEAFAGVRAAVVVIPDSCTAVGARAFRGCENLRMIRIPAGCTVGEDAFADCELVFVFGYVGSSAQSYCEAHENCVFTALSGEQA